MQKFPFSRKANVCQFYYRLVCVCECVCVCVSVSKNRHTWVGREEETTAKRIPGCCGGATRPVKCCPSGKFEIFSFRARQKLRLQLTLNSKTSDTRNHEFFVWFVAAVFFREEETKKNPENTKRRRRTFGQNPPIWLLPLSCRM